MKARTGTTSVSGVALCIGSCGMESWSNSITEDEKAVHPVWGEPL